MPLTSVTQTTAQAVKKQTEVLHRQTENVLLPKLQAVKTLQEYATILKMFYGYFHPLQERIVRHLDQTILPELHKRRTANLLKEDLAALGIKADLPLCASLPKINNVADAFGAMYVLEGSTLGGRLIAKMLASNQFINIPADALRFFEGYKEETGPMWTAFVDALNSVQASDEVAAAARDTFYQLRKWMEITFADDTAN